MAVRLDGANLLTRQQRAECNVVELNSRNIAIARRDKALSIMGFASYQEYLSSDLWRKIRKIVFSFNSKCCVCSKPSSQAHHINYSIDALEGNVSAVKSCIVPMCENCHQKVHFKGCQFLVGRGSRKKLRKLRP